MRFEIEKLEHLKKLSSALYIGQKRADKLSKQTDNSVFNNNRWQNLHATLCRENMGNEKIAIKINRIVIDLGFGDFDQNGKYHNGRSEIK
jgi:hypothetical protein